VVHLPPDVLLDKIAASLEDGVLMVGAADAEEHQQRQQHDLLGMLLPWSCS
jgi:HSP20 family molecular chaperone IbpA